jgi:hypothetical protein
MGIELVSKTALITGVELWGHQNQCLPDGNHNNIFQCPFAEIAITVTRFEISRIRSQESLFF